jgi:hypothetical protein
VSIALVTQHSNGIPRIALPSVACLAQQYFSTLSLKHAIFGEKTLLNTKCVISFSLKHFVVELMGIVAVWFIDFVFFK